MIHHPFSPSARAPAQGWFARHLRRPDVAAATAAAERALATAAPAVPSDREVAAILAEHRVAGRRARTIGMTLWLRALHACIDDDVVTDEELAYLEQLRIGLNLRERDVDDLWSDETGAIYRTALEGALSDGKLTDDEWRQVDLIASGLRLSPERRAEIAEEPIASAITRAVTGALADHRLTPAEREQLTELVTQTGVGQDAYTDTQEQALDRALLLWRIENEALPVIAAPINLQKGEVCHASFSAQWYELRTRTVRSYRSGPVASIRIMKGLSYRVGSYQTHRVTADELTLIDAGVGYITNKRFIFDGARKNTTIRYPGILSLTPYADGVEIEKATGKSPTLIIQGDAEIFTAIFAEALSRS
jgi:hypothetical protein